MKFLIATNNQNKLTQFKRIFKKYLPKVEIVSLKDVGITQDVKEDQETLIENAKKKAKFFGQKSGLITISDDTGLFIDALNGEPGLHSKRWLEGTDQERNIKILEIMQDLPDPERNCRYTGALALYNPQKDLFWIFEDSLEGRISKTVNTDGLGFGYDPIFISLAYNKYYSDLTDQERDDISHRGLGIKKLAKQIEKLL